MGSKEEVKFQDKQISVTKNPVMVVGQNPGRQRKGQTTNIAWEGNKSSDLFMWCIEGLENIYLTNVCNYQQMTEQRVIEGAVELRAKIDFLKPRKIITVGEFASFIVSTIDPDVPITHFYHPSYIVRFNRNKMEYSEQIRKAIQ